MKFCPECGAKTEGSKFCPECGLKLVSFNNDEKPNEITNKQEEENVSLDDLMFMASDAENSKNQEREQQKLSDILSNYEYEKHLDGTISIIKLKRKSNINIVLPEGVVSIEKEAFMDTDIMNVVLPNSMVRIGDRAFKGCKDLLKINIPSNVMFLGDEVFADCEQLEVEIPEKVLKQGYWIIRNTKTERLMEDANQRKMAEEAEKQRKLEEERLKAEEKKQAEEAERKRRLAEERKAKAQEKKRLLQIQKQEEEEALKKQLEIERLQAEQKKKEEEEALKKQREIERLEAEQKEREYEAKKKLLFEQAEIEAKYEVAGRLQKKYPQFLYTVNNNNEITLMGIPKYSVVGTYKKSEAEIKARQDIEKGILEIPNGVEAIRTGAFEGSKIKTVILPASVKVIRDKAFYNCKELKKINLENVTHIGKQAFCKCKSLKKVDLTCVVSLGASAFTDTAIKKVTVKKDASFSSSTSVGGAGTASGCFPEKCKIKKI